MPSFSLKSPSWVFDRLWLRLDPGALSRLSKDIHNLIPVFVLQDNLHKSYFLLAERRGRRRRFEEGASTGEKRPLSEAVEAVRWGGHSEEGDGGHGDVASLLCVCLWSVWPLAHRQGAGVPSQSTVQGIHPLQAEPCRDRLVQAWTRTGGIRWDTGRDIVGPAVAG